jgi:hypothetical protein
VPEFRKAVLQIFPFALWLAVVTSAVLLGVLWAAGELGVGHIFALCGWFLIAGYCQFFAGSNVIATVGLVLQTFLAIYLLLRWKLAFW